MRPNCEKAWVRDSVCYKSISDEEAGKTVSDETKLSTVANANNPETRPRVGETFRFVSSTNLTARQLSDWFVDSGCTQHMTDQ